MLKFIKMSSFSVSFHRKDRPAAVRVLPQVLPLSVLRQGFPEVLPQALLLSALRQEAFPVLRAVPEAAFPVSVLRQEAFRVPPAVPEAPSVFWPLRFFFQKLK